MITQKELTEVSLSPTKKDYYQIWNELVELAAKISDRWSPATTNESDPGIVLLKALTAIADKLNYNIDKNTLEAFMPSATQEDSMRKLCEMMGYSMKYYQAATTNVTIGFKSTDTKTIKDFDSIGGILFPKFTNLKNEEEDINYVTLEQFALSSTEPTRTILAAEGELVECETDNDNIISMLQIDDNKRYLLPETNIAENCIFITNISDNTESAEWKKIDNLNTQLPASKIFKFGFNSITGVPYIQFPDDISQIIEDGLKIRYIRTNGLSGNISRGKLTKLEKPALWSTLGTDDESYALISALTPDNFTVDNPYAAITGTNPETLTSAYNNYKKIIGTFDTLVTCRDYMNKIYLLQESETDTTPLVSNVVVSDIRDDINRSTILCSFNEYGIYYDDKSLIVGSTNAIDHFDLMLYPFKTVYGLNTYEEYKNSFKYSSEKITEIAYELQDSKTIAHEFVNPDPSDIACIKNYLRLQARITTTKKVKAAEEAEILTNIYSELFKNFNARKLDFGEEIPYDSIVESIKNADRRIKDISLDEPALYTVFEDVEGNEYDLAAAADLTDAKSIDTREIYNKLARRNILAGRIAAFQYNENFKSDYHETVYPTGVRKIGGDPVTFETEYPTSGNYISKVESEFKVVAAEHAQSEIENPALFLKLKENEVIQFRLPNFRTVVTYPAYVNYYIMLNAGDKVNVPAAPATFVTLGSFLSSASYASAEGISWTAFVNNSTIKGLMKTIRSLDAVVTETVENFNAKKAFYGEIFVLDGTNFVVATTPTIDGDVHFETSYVFQVDNSSIGALTNWLKSQTIFTTTLSGLFRSLGADTSRTIGYYINASFVKYMPAYTYETSMVSPLERYYVQQAHDPVAEADDITNNVCTEDGLGRNAVYPTIGVNAEYQLGTGEYLLINYTDSSTNDAGTETKAIINRYYGEGTIIKPNFAIISSELYHNTHSYTKTSGFYFEKMPSCPGMFTLGANEQIAIRDLVKVDLTGNAYLYWELNSDDNTADTNTFLWTEDFGGGTDNAYTLKENEHFYYTNESKTDLVYYGSGTLIVKSANTPTLIKRKADGLVSDEDIMTYGLSAAIPWIPYNLGATGDVNNTKYIRVIENQYISLTEGDILEYISNTEDETAFDVDLSNEWVDVKTATYQFVEKENPESLPKAIFVDSSIGGWQARSRLDFNMSQDTTQTLHENNYLTITYKPLPVHIEDTDAHTIVLEPLNISVTPGNPETANFVDLSVNSNYILQLATDTIDVTDSGTDLIGTQIAANFKIKLTSKSAISINPSGLEASNILNLNNYKNGGTYYTKFNCKELANIVGYVITNAAFKLNTTIPTTDKYGLVMFYYKDEILEGAMAYEGDAYFNLTGNIVTWSEDGGTTTKTHTIAKLAATGGNLCKFNVGATPAATYVLTPGINVIQVAQAVTGFAVYPDGDLQSAIVFGELSTVTGINPKLDYQFTDEVVKNDDVLLAKLLTDIAGMQNAVVSDFYYNVPITNDSAIEINPNIDADLLSSPLVWYDTNNVNNKFVISEIDADFLSKGITLTRASKVL